MKCKRHYDNMYNHSVSWLWRLDLSDKVILLLFANQKRRRSNEG